MKKLGDFFGGGIGGAVGAGAVRSAILSQPPKHFLGAEPALTAFGGPSPTFVGVFSP